MPRPFHVALVLTHDCTLACDYCYMGAKSKRSMSVEIARAAIEHALVRHEAVDVGFCGGEPLLEYERLIEIVHLAQRRAQNLDRCLRLQVTTNGTRLTEARARKLQSLGVKMVLSLDGVRWAHDLHRRYPGGASSHEAVVTAAQCILRAGSALEVVMVLAPDAVRALAESVAFLVDLGARRIVLNPWHEADWRGEHLSELELGLSQVADIYAARLRAGTPVAISPLDDKLYAAVRGRGIRSAACSFGQRNFAVAPSGAVYACERLVADDTDDRFRIGRVRTDATLELAPRAPFDATESEPCASCAEAWRCNRYCACANLAATGDLTRPGGFQCWLERTTARLADQVGHALIRERCPSFLTWAYGELAPE